jgi:hypothetical protein
MIIAAQKPAGWNPAQTRSADPGKRDPDLEHGTAGKSGFAQLPYAQLLAVEMCCGASGAMQNDWG